MFQFGSCPRCQSKIDDQRLQFRPQICPACGFNNREKEIKTQDGIEKRFIKTAVSLTVFFVVAFVQATSWDKYALEIIPLKIEQTIGMANSTDLQRIADICKERKKHACVEDALFSLASNHNNDALGELAKYQMKLGKLHDAATNFKQYFDRGGLDLEASYQYGKALGKLGQVELASNYFDQVLKAKPDTLQITVTQNYVKMLMENGRTAQAVGLIEAIRESGPAANLFMDTELHQLKQVTK